MRYQSTTTLLHLRVNQVIYALVFFSIFLEDLCVEVLYKIEKSSLAFKKMVSDSIDDAESNGETKN